MARYPVIGSCASLLLGLALAGAAGGTGSEPPERTGVPIPKAPVVPSVAPPPCPVITKLDRAAAQAVQESGRAVHEYQTGVGPAGNALAHSGDLVTHQLNVNRLAEACLARTYTASDNASAGCVSRDTPARCAKKLFDWCMQPPYAALKQQRDAMVQARNTQLRRVQAGIQNTMPLIYPSS
jgi:hypothetical protein